MIIIMIIIIIIIICTGSEEELVRFCFNIYDLNEDGYITKEEIMTMMKDCFIVHSNERDEEGDGVKDLVEMTMRKMDRDKDGRISLSDFQESVTEEPLLLEAFGNCLPTSPTGVEFVERILDRQVERRNVFYSC